MKYILETYEHFLYLKLKEPKLNSEASLDLKSQFMVIHSDGHKNIVMDLSLVKFIDSSGLSSLLVGHRLCHYSQGSLILTGLDEHVTKLVNIAQLDTVLTIVPTLKDAKELLIKEAIEHEKHHKKHVE